MPLPRLELTGQVRDQVFAAVHAAIINGELRPGARLRIRDVAAELGTSVMPVREAIRRLEEMGLIETAPYRGAVVKGFTHTELLDLYAVRRLLEVEAAQIGTEHATPADVELLRRELDAMEAAVTRREPLDYLDRDEAFLAILYAASGNAVLLELVRTLWHRCRAYKILGAERALTTGDPAALVLHQRHILDAVVARDSAAAALTTATSLDDATSRIRASMADD